MKKMLLISFIIILSMIFTACGHDCIDPLPPGPPDDGSEKLLEDGKLYMENEEYDIAVDCFIQVLDIRPENYEAILSLERIFRQTIKQKDLELSQKIYSYIATSHSKHLYELQLIFEEYDMDVLDTYRVCLADAFFSDENKGVKELKGVDMELTAFINAYDSSGFKNVFYETYGKTESELGKDLIYFTDDATLIDNLEIHVIVHDFREGYLDISFYIPDTKQVFSDDPIYINKYDENDLETYSSSLEGIQDNDVK